MKSIIIYNTKSGNTQELAEKMKDILIKYNHESEIYRDKEIKKTPEIVNDFNLMCIGSPTHVGGPAYFPFRKLVKKISKLNMKNKKLVCFATSASDDKWKNVCKYIRKKIDKAKHIADIGCKKRENEEAIAEFKKIMKTL